jgi:hypothetical protein
MEFHEMVTKAKKHQSLSHYTSFDALESILHNRSIKLSRMDKINDLYEEDRNYGFWSNKVFVACFTHESQESILYWYIYTGKRKEEGIMIKAPTKFLMQNIKVFADCQCSSYEFSQTKQSDPKITNYQHIDDWGIYDTTWADISYVKNFTKYECKLPIYEDLKDCVNLSERDLYESIHVGFLKSIPWHAEKETRLRVSVRPKGLENTNRGVEKPSFEEMYFFLQDDLLKSFEIILNPWADQMFENKVKVLLKQENLSMVKIRRSEIHGTIR